MPLNPILVNRMPRDVRALYDMGVRLETSSLLSAVQSHVRHQRTRNRWRTMINGRLVDGRVYASDGVTRVVDPLAERARLFPNVGDYAKELARKLSARLFEHKIPANTLDRAWRTIEFECFFPNEEKYREFCAKVRAMGLVNQTTIKDDGSLSDYRNNSRAVDKEIVFSFRKGDENSVRKICALFAECGAYVNKSCGTHVHFDMRGLSESEVQLRADRVAKYVPILRRMLPEERRNNHFCHNIINTPVRGDRYAFVNMQAFTKHGTLEIRGHSGTLNATKILNWIEICDTIMHVRVRATFDVNTVLDLALLYKLDRSLANYMVAREAKFTDASADEMEGMRQAA